MTTVEIPLTRRQWLSRVAGVIGAALAAPGLDVSRAGAAAPARPQPQEGLQ